MKTINQILKNSWYTKEFLLECEKIWRCNWCWWKGWIQWTKQLRKLKFFNSNREQKLLDNLDLVSDIHDIDFENNDSKNIFESIKAFYIANYNLIIRILQLLYWTTKTGRLSVFLLAFFWLNIFWIRFFNWKFKK